MIERIELAKSNFSRCKKCGRRIKKGQPRGVDYTSFVCYKCFKNKNNEDIKLLQRLNKDFEVVLKSKSKELILEELNG